MGIIVNLIHGAHEYRYHEDLYVTRHYLNKDIHVKIKDLSKLPIAIL